jgi:hypothetical protein
MVTMKRLKTTCILAGATTVLMVTGCHSSSSTTQASAKSHQQLANTTQKKSAQVAANNSQQHLQTYDNYWESSAPDAAMAEPIPQAEPSKPAAPAPAPTVAETPAPAPVQPTFTPPPAAAPEPVAQAPAPTPAPVQPTYTAPAPTPAPAPVAQAPAPAPTPAPAQQTTPAQPAPAAQPVAQNTQPQASSNTTPRYLDENSAPESGAEITESEQLLHTQECAGARAEATLYPEQFDGPGLTSLGTRALDLMLQDPHSCNPLVLYLDIPDDSLAEERRLTIGRYLEDRGGLKPEQIEFHYGTNPGNYHAADVQLTYYLAKTDTAADSGGASASSSSSSGH